MRQWIHTWSSREKLETEAHILGLNDVSQGESLVEERRSRKTLEKCQHF